MANPNPPNKFTKGKSGNPNGRPKKGTSMREIFESYGNLKDPQFKKTRNELVVDALFKLAYVDEDIQAIKYILDRNLGKPKETVDTNLSIEMPKVIELTSNPEEVKYEIIDEDIHST